jgi:hypothetical protein
VSCVKQRSDSPRVLSFIDWTGTGDGLESARFEALQSFMLVALVAHCGMLLGRTDELGSLAGMALEPVFVLSALVGLASKSARPYCVLVTFCATSLWVVIAWPNFANHLFLEWSILLFLCLCQRDKLLGINALRWLTAIVLFHTGLQKLVTGHYFQGQTLTALVARKANFKDFLGLVLSDADSARLMEMGGRIETGPYISTDPIFLVMSNAVWVSEMGLAVLLIVSKRRRFAVWAAFAMILSIELGAREMVFGCLFATLILAFYERKNALVWWPVLAGLQVLSMLATHFLPALRLN